MNKINKMKQLKERGLSYQSIGKVFGISRQRVHQLISGYITPDKRDRGKGTHKELIKLYDLVYERDNWTCQKCGKVSKYKINKPRKRDIIIHHIDGSWKNQNSNNLICLCGKCHLWLHKPKQKM